MIVYAVSDLHGLLLPDVPGDADLLILAGDICPDFLPYSKRQSGSIDKGGVQQAAWLDTTFREWLQGVVDQGTEVVAIWGNHDFVGERSYLVPKGLPWTLLTDQEVNVGGLRIWGTPWVPGLPRWAFYMDSDRLRLRADAIPADLDILISHGPPRDAGDFVPTNHKQVVKYGNMHGEHVGDAELYRAIELARPQVTVCGHIHEDRGVHFVGDQVVYNVAAVDGCYAPYPNPLVRLYEFD